jgi:hypothetical protein
MSTPVADGGVVRDGVRPTVLRASVGTTEVQVKKGIEVVWARSGSSVDANLRPTTGSEMFTTIDADHWRARPYSWRSK